MMRVLLYASDDKLKTISGQPHWLDRLDLSLGVGVPVAKVTAGLRPRDPATLLQLVDEADKKISDEHAARGLAESVSGRPPPLFSFNGPAGHLDEDGVFWVAGIDDNVGFILAGSSENTIATPAAPAGHMLSPSADPIGTIKSFFASKGAPEHSSMIAYVWQTVLATTNDAGGVEAAPWISGVAVYAGRISLEEAPSPTAASSQPGVTDLLVGSPLWVEQT